MRHENVIDRDYSALPPVMRHAVATAKQTQISSFFHQEKYPHTNHWVAQKTALGVIILGNNGDILFVWGISNETSKLLGQNHVDREDGDRFITILKGLRQKVLEGKTLTEKVHLSMAPNIQFITNKTRLSCRGLLLKGMGEDTTVMILVQSLLRERRQLFPARIPYKFSPRERSVIQYIKKGHTNKEIANALGIGVDTIKSHIKRIMKKMDVHTRAGIVGKISGQAD